MQHSDFSRIISVFLAFLLILAGLRYLIPLLLPFLLGWMLAFLVQPQSRFMQQKLHFPRMAASAAAVTAGLALLALMLMVLASVLYREAGILIRGLPEAMEAFGEKALRLQQWALELSRRAPIALQLPLMQMVRNLFTGGSILVERATAVVLQAAKGLVGGISGGAVLAGTSVVAAFLISGQYPQLQKRMVESVLWKKYIFPLLKRIRGTLVEWMKAQLKLGGVCFGIVSIGFLLLRVKQPLLWAALTAFVDAVPMLGTGTVLIPMALISLIWGDRVRGIGLLGLYLTAMVTRSALEPKLVGKQLGLNPLATLMAMYLGLRLWGIVGMILSPVLAVLAVQLSRSAD